MFGIQDSTSSWSSRLWSCGVHQSLNCATKFWKDSANSWSCHCLTLRMSQRSPSLRSSRFCFQPTWRALNRFLTRSTSFWKTWRLTYPRVMRSKQVQLQCSIWFVAFTISRMTTRVSVTSNSKCRSRSFARSTSIALRLSGTHTSCFYPRFCHRKIIASTTLN